MPLDTKQIGLSIGLIGGVLYILKKRRDAHKFQIISCSQCGSLSDGGCDFCGDCMSCCMCYQFHAENYDLSLLDPSINSNALGLFKIDKKNIGLTALNDTTHLAIHDWDPYPDELPVDDKIVQQYDFYGVDNKGRTYFGDGFLVKEDLFPYGDLMLENAEIGGGFYNIGFMLNEKDAWFVAESFDAETWTTEHPTRDKSEVVCVKCKSPAHDCWCERCPQCEEFWNEAWINCESCFSCDECCKKSCPELWDAESLDAEEWRKHYEIHGTMADDDGRCVRCGSNAGFDYEGGCLTCLDVASQELPYNEAESFAASPPAIFEDDERGPREPRHDCAICGRPYTISRLGRELIQHYLKESENGTLEFKSKEFPNGTRRTARTVAGYFLYREGLDALNEYVLYAPKSNLSPKIEELLKSSLVQRIVAGDVVNLIEMLELDDRTDDSPTFGESFEKEFEAEGFK